MEGYIITVQMGVALDITDNIGSNKFAMIYLYPLVILILNVKISNMPIMNQSLL